MEILDWEIISRGLDESKRSSRDALFTTGNGMFGIRGFCEEETSGIGRLGGIYMAGVFGKGYSEVCSGPSSELCNLPQVLRIGITANGEAIAPSSSALKDFSQKLNFKNGEYTHRYQVTLKDAVLELVFRRFADLTSLHQIWQSVTVTCLSGSCTLDMTSGMDGNVTNLNWQSCEPLPIQPGRNHFSKCEIKSDTHMVMELDNPKQTKLSLAQALNWRKNQISISNSSIMEPLFCGQGVAVTLEAGDVLSLDKTIHVGADFQRDPWEAQQDSLSQQAVDYDLALEDHSLCWNKRWQTADLKIQGPVRDQGALRYNIFELMAVCPLHSNSNSIGARGLSGEMYEGCVFWDNEIFQLPFFCWSEQTAARRLLEFRHNTLDEARKRATELWFEGALYPWQVDVRGREQTIKEGGAYYAIHIVGDIAYAISKYLHITHDWDFLLQGGTEILIETARFWVSRCDFDENDQHYHIRSVRGPNEYDVYVDDNAYTNTMAAHNLTWACKGIDLYKERSSEDWNSLCQKLQFSEEEYTKFQEIAANLAIPRHPESGMILEDNRYHLRRPLSLAKAKPTPKRIIDSTLPYEALPLYQVTKQADVVLLMCLFPSRYTAEEKALAFDYYEPKTAHDSSLSYAPYGLMAAILNRSPEAYDYFQKCAFLEVDDRQLNSISGLHYANFGGTWQIAFHGFAGISEENGAVHIRPQLPTAWSGYEVSFYFQKSLIQVTYEKKTLKIKLIEGGEKAITFIVNHTSYQLSVSESACCIQID